MLVDKAKEIKLTTSYKHGVINSDFLQGLIKISIEERSPILAQDYLRSHGINLVVEPHLPKTYLDGAVILKKEENPIIGLTIRHDRLDNFWFTLLH